MKRIIFVITWQALFFLSSIHASGSSASIFINSFTIPQTGQIVVPVKVTGFDSILSAQGTITFDTAMLMFSSIEQMGLPGMNASQFGTDSALTVNGKITYAWNANPDTVSVADSTVIFAIRFNVMGQAGRLTTVGFSNAPTSQQVVDIHSNVVSTTYTDGQIIIPCSEFFTLDADPHQMSHYLLTNYPNGLEPVKYDWNWGDGTTDDTIPYPSHAYAVAGFYTICVTINDSTGCQAGYCDSSTYVARTANTMIYVTVVNPLITGIKQAEQKMIDMIIYPNPANEEFVVSCPQLSGNETLTIYNMLGEIIYTQNMNSPQEIINCKQLFAGIYFVQMKTENFCVIKKFVKE